MRRREFVSALGGAAVWPLVARAQQAERVRRIGVLINLSENDPMGPGFVAVFQQQLQELGWVDGRNARIDIRWGAGGDDRYRQYAAELVGLAPDVSPPAGGAAARRGALEVPRQARCSGCF
jgi:putative tryptophan/tyrosine transport system substrate-binding protein